MSSFLTLSRHLEFCAVVTNKKNDSSAMGLLIPEKSVSLERYALSSHLFHLNNHSQLIPEEKPLIFLKPVSPGT